MTAKKNIQDSICHRKPDIAYPCEWEYKVIGTDKSKLEEIIIEACQPTTPSIALSNVSSKGRYYSLNATLRVENEEVRLAIFKRIMQHPEVKMVL
ncbi:MAG: DUF493 domain-containing protein [Desulfobacterales bacterium]|nr:DUF493 domain-containing protein [Desulfobacterales bacterium]